VTGFFLFMPIAIVLTLRFCTRPRPACLRCCRARRGSARVAC
jgi:hypothetical protein